MINLVKFEDLPKDVQAEAKDTLECYDEVNVIYENGAFHVETCTCISASYAHDFIFLGVYKAVDVFTEEERILNYVNNFHDYPIQYKGYRDYHWLQTLTWDDKVTFDDKGNIVLAITK